MNVTVKVCEPIKRNGKWDLVEHTEEREYPDGRHSVLCAACGFPSYPDCREWCTQQGYKTAKS